MTLYSDKMVEHWEWFIMFVIKRIEVCGRIWKKYWIKRFMMKNGYCCHKCKINIENKHLLKFTCEYIRESMIKKKRKTFEFSHTDSCFSIYWFSLCFFFTIKNFRNIVVIPRVFQVTIFHSYILLLFCSIRLLLCADTNP